MTSIVIWNIRGFNYPAKQKAIRELISQSKLAICGLLETKVKVEKLEKVLNAGRIHMKAVANHGFHHNRRVLLLWNDELVDIQVLSMSSQFIHVLVTSKVSPFCFHFTLIYAFNTSEGRTSLWQDLQLLSRQISTPWLIGGDFNTTLAYGEKMTGGEVVT